MNKMWINKICHFTTQKIVLWSILSIVSVNHSYENTAFGERLNVSQDTLTLEKALELGLKNNFQIQLVKLDVKEVNQEGLLGPGAFLPRVTLQGSGTQTIGETFSADGVSRDKSLGAQITGQWTLFDGFQMFHAYSLLNQRKEIVGLQQRREVEGQSLEIVRRYLNTVIQERLWITSTKQKDFSRIRLQEAQNAYELGGRTRLELLQAQLAYQQDSAAWHGQQIKVLESRSDLNLLLGVGPDVVYVLSWDGYMPDFKKAFRVPDELWKEVKQYNAELSLSEQQVEMRRTERSIQRSAFWPKFILRGNYGVTRSFENFSEEHLETKQGQVGLHVEYPLFQGFTQYVNLKKSNVALQKEMISNKQLELRLQHLVYRQWNTVEQALKQTDVEQLGVSLAEERWELAQDSYERGQLSGLELREAQLDLQRAIVNHLSVLIQARLSVLELERMAGKVRL